MKKEKIGFGLVTYNRENYFKLVTKKFYKLPVDEIVIVNDGTPYKKYPKNAHIIEHKKNKGVGITKNDAIKYLMDKDCDYIFIMEDDIIIKDLKIFKKYIELYKITGIHHFNFGYHGPANMKNDKPNPKQILKIRDDLGLALNHNAVGAFSFFTKKSLEDVGLFDENYKNATEHLDHTYLMGKKGYHPPFWWFADLADSYNYLSEIACSEISSVIRFTDNWRTNVQMGFHIFQQKYGVHVLNIPKYDVNYVIQQLRTIRNKHALV